MAGLAGALAAPIIGIVAPNQFAVLPSILMVVLGGRRRPGHALGRRRSARCWSAGRKTSFSESRPDDWLYLQGLLFVVVVAFVPGGIAGAAALAGRLPPLAGGAGVGADGPPAPSRRRWPTTAEARDRMTASATAPPTVLEVGSWRSTSTASGPSTASTSPSTRASCAS